MKNKKIASLITVALAVIFPITIPQSCLAAEAHQTPTKHSKKNVKRSASKRTYTIYSEGVLEEAVIKEPLSSVETQLKDDSYYCEENFNSLEGSNQSSLISLDTITGGNLSKTEKLVNTSSILYLPYFQVGGVGFYNADKVTTGASLDLFAPLWQPSPANLVFTHLRFFDRFGRTVEGNIHVGYRHLSLEKEYLYGIYGAFDWKKSRLGHNFNQLTLGVESWFQKIFFGGNVYYPIGNLSRFVEIVNERGDIIDSTDSNQKKLWLTGDLKEEKALGGADFEFGYEFTKGLVGYVGGYYFARKDVNTIYGPKARLTYDWTLENGKRILGVFDKLGLEAGIQRDKPRGTTGYFGVNFRFDLLPDGTSNLQGVARHMVDLVRRDVDIVDDISSSINTYSPGYISPYDLVAGKIRGKRGRSVRIVHRGKSSEVAVDDIDGIVNSVVPPSRFFFSQVSFGGVEDFTEEVLSAGAILLDPIYRFISPYTKREVEIDLSSVNFGRIPDVLGPKTKPYVDVPLSLSPEANVKKYASVPVENVKKYDSLVPELSPEQPQKKYDEKVVTAIIPEQPLKKYEQALVFEDIKKSCLDPALCLGITELTPEQQLKKYNIVNVVEDIKKYNHDVIELTSEQLRKKYHVVEVELAPGQSQKKYEQVALADAGKKYNPDITELTPEQPLKKDQAVGVVDNFKKYVPVALVEIIKKYTSVSTEVSPEQPLKKHAGVAVVDNIKKHDPDTTEIVADKLQKKYAVVTTEVTPEEHLQKAKEYVEVGVQVSPAQSMKKDTPVSVIENIKRHVSGITEPTPEQSKKKYSPVETELTSGQSQKKYEQVALADAGKKYNSDITELTPEQPLKKDRAVGVVDNFKKYVPVALVEIIKKYTSVSTEVTSEQERKKYAKVATNLTAEQLQKKYQPVMVVENIKKLVSGIAELAPEKDQNKHTVVPVELISEQSQKKYTSVPVALSPEQPLNKHTEVAVVDNVKKFVPVVTEIASEKPQKKHLEVATALTSEQMLKKYAPAAVEVLPEQLRKKYHPVASVMATDKLQKKHIAIATEVAPEQDLDKKLTKPYVEVATQVSSEQSSKKYAVVAVDSTPEQAHKKYMGVVTELMPEQLQKKPVSVAIVENLKKLVSGITELVPEKAQNKHTAVPMELVPEQSPKKYTEVTVVKEIKKHTPSEITEVGADKKLKKYETVATEISPPQPLKKYQEIATIKKTDEQVVIREEIRKLIEAGNLREALVELYQGDDNGAEEAARKQILGYIKHRRDGEDKPRLDTYLEALGVNKNACSGFWCPRGSDVYDHQKVIVDLSVAEYQPIDTELLPDQPMKKHGTITLSPIKKYVSGETQLSPERQQKKYAPVSLVEPGKQKPALGITELASERLQKKHASIPVVLAPEQRLNKHTEVAVVDNVKKFAPVVTEIGSEKLQKKHLEVATAPTSGQMLKKYAPAAVEVLPGQPRKKYLPVAQEFTPDAPMKKQNIFIPLLNPEKSYDYIDTWLSPTDFIKKSLSLPVVDISVQDKAAAINSLIDEDDGEAFRIAMESNKKRKDKGK